MSSLRQRLRGCRPGNEGKECAVPRARAVAELPRFSRGNRGQTGTVRRKRRATPPAPAPPPALHALNAWLRSLGDFGGAGHLGDPQPELLVDHHNLTTRD